MSEKCDVEHAGSKNERWVAVKPRLEHKARSFKMVHDLATLQSLRAYNSFIYPFILINYKIEHHGTNEIVIYLSANVDQINKQEENKAKKDAKRVLNSEQGEIKNMAKGI